MSRIARKNINAHFIHVMVQGVNREFIFENQKHMNYYLKSIKSESHYKEFDMLAYCMMNNHAHFLFHVDDMNAFSQFMKSVNQNFANLYNLTKDRVGVVFRNRYQIEPIHDFSHLKNCIKYIHNNPVKARIVQNCWDYPYSSYHDYLNKKGCGDSWILKKLFGENVVYLDEIAKADNKRFMDYDDVSANAYEMYFDDGINCFKKEFNYSLLDIFSERNILIKFITYLKKEFRLDYNETIKYLGFPRGLINKIKQN